MTVVVIAMLFAVVVGEFVRRPDATLPSVVGDDVPLTPWRAF